MNDHLHRGPLPNNMNHMLHFEGSRPPPTPREMYSEEMYASIEEQGHYDHKKQAPPPPKRDPNTRLSSTSQSLGQSNYQEIQVQESHHHQYKSHHNQQTHTQHHHQQQQQYNDYHQQYDLQQHHQLSQQQQRHQQSNGQQHHYTNQQQHHHHQHQYTYDQQTRRDSGHGSPVSRSKFSHEPQSPSHVGDKPFSYGQLMSPKLNRVQNGGGHHTQTAPMSPTRHEFHREESPVMSYGKHESTFPSQAHRPPPHGPPPPVPPSQGSQSPRYPSSPVLPRHSVTSLQGNGRPQEHQRSSPPKLSQRSMSVPCNGNNGQILPKTQQQMPGHGFNVMGHNVQRTPSPPLPPPPPELMELTYHSPPPQQQYQHQQSQHHQQNCHVLSQMPQGVVNQGQSLPNAQSPRHIAATNARTTQQAPPPPPLSSIPRKKTETPVSSTQILDQNRDHLNRPRKGSCPVDINGNTAADQKSRNKSHSPSPMRGSYDSAADQTGLLHQISKVQLKKTGGRQSFEDGLPVEEVQPTSPPPQPASPPVSKETTPTKDEIGEVIPVNSAVNMFEKKVEMVTQEDNRIKRRGDTSKNSSMDINIDDIDLNDVPGYTPVTKSTPIWKRDMIEKKNQEKIEEYIAKKRKEKEDAEKWKNVPAWKRKLMMEKEKEKEQKTDAEIKQPAISRNVMKEEEEQRKARIREQQEMEKKMEEELQDVPAWKREIMMKRGGAIKNWTDEREDINEQELEEQQRLAELEAQELAMQSLPPPPPDLDLPEPPTHYEAQKEEPTPSPPPPAQTQQSKASVVLKPQAPKQEVKKAAAPRPSIDENKLEDEWESLPLWKREIMMKRGGAPSNWGDEREDKNEEGVEQ